MHCNQNANSGSCKRHKATAAAATHTPTTTTTTTTATATTTTLRQLMCRSLTLSTFCLYIVCVDLARELAARTFYFALEIQFVAQRHTLRMRNVRHGDCL